MNASPIKMLIVDDSPLYGFLAAQVVEMVDGVGVEKSIAGNPRDAMKIFQQKKPDITFLDINLLSDESGLDLLDRFLEIDPQAYVVMMTGRAEAAVVQRAKDAGAQGYILKPFTAEKVNEAIRRYQLFCKKGKPSARNPAYRAPSAKPAEAISLRDVFAGWDVLCVTPDTRVTPLFVDLPCRVRLVGNGKEALTYLNKNHVDVMLFEANLPDMDGFQVANQVRLKTREAPIRTLSIALFENKADVNPGRMKLAGVTEHITKPVSREGFQKLLQAYARLYWQQMNQPYAGS